MNFIFRTGQYFGTSQNGIEDKKNGTEGVLIFLWVVDEHGWLELR